MKNYYVIILLVWLVPMLGHAQSSSLTKVAISTQSNQASSTNPLGFVEYLPENFDNSGFTKYPVLYWLHGAGDNGSGSLSDLDNVYNITISNWLKSSDIPFIVLIPQDPYGFFGGGAINNFVSWSNEEYGQYIDSNQQHMAGLSGGGYGMRIFIMANSDLAQSFATYTLMSTDFNDADTEAHAQNIIENNQHVWFHHGTVDGGGNAMSRIQGFHQKVYDLDAQRSRLTAYVGMGHSAWHEVYDASGRSKTQLEGLVDGYNYYPWTDEDQDWYEWLLAHSKSADTTVLNPIVDVDPSITNATSIYGVMNSEGLVISQTPEDDQATHVKITNISGGELFLNNGTTLILNGDFINFSDGEVGLRFLPTSVGTGSFDIQSSLSDSDQDLMGSVIGANIAVSKATVTVAANDYSREYGEPNPDFTFVYSGFLFGQDESVLDVQPSISTSAVQSSEAGEYEITLTGGSDDHYEFDLTHGTLTVIMTELNDPFVTDVTAPYGTFNSQRLAVFRSPLDSYEASHFKVTNVQGGNLYLNDGETMVSEGEFLTFLEGAYGLKFLPEELSTGSFDIQAAISDDDYGLRAEIISAHIEVTKAELIIIVEDATIMEGDEIPTFYGSVSGINESDNITVSYTTTATADSTAGTYPITATFIDPDMKAGNYEITIQEGTLTIEEDNGTFIPDDNFEQALIDLGYDDLLDDRVLTENISSVTTLAIQNKGISDLTGIEAFGSLVDLDVSSNNLSSLDLSANGHLETLICHSNALTTLDLSSNPNLTLLYCQKNQITSIDLSANPALNDFYSRYNNLSYLDLSAIDNLARLNVLNNDLGCILLNQEQLDNIPTHWYKDDIARYGTYCNATYVPDDNFEQALIDLGYDSGELDDYVNTEIIQSLTNLDISNQGISDFTGLMDFESLTTLYCQGNLSPLLDVSGSTNLTLLNAMNSPHLTCIQVNQIQLSDIPAGWSKDNMASYSRFCTSTYVPDQNFEQALIDLGYDDTIDGYVLNSNIESVTELNLENKEISDATGVEGFTSLIDLNINTNSLTTLDLSGNLALKTLSCRSNSLTSLDMSSNTELTLLYCQKNQITSLNLSQNTELYDLYAKNNQIGSLDLSNSAGLIRLNVEENLNLTCIRVNEDQLENTPTAWYKDATSSYDTSCGSGARVATLSLPETDLKKVSLYPNPAGDFFTLDMGTLDDALLEVYDASGNQIFDTVNLSEGQNKISTQGLSKGMIILKVISKDKNMDMKLLLK